MRKVFEINGCIETPMDITEDEFWETFIDFIEANHWDFGGSTRELSEDEAILARE